MVDVCELLSRDWTAIEDYDIALSVVNLFTYLTVYFCFVEMMHNITTDVRLFLDRCFFLIIKNVLLLFLKQLRKLKRVLKQVSQITAVLY